MNSRIQKLWDEAAESTQDDSWQSQTLFMERFAELIVAECCVALHPMMRDMISRTQAVDMIVAHFRDQ